MKRSALVLSAIIAFVLANTPEKAAEVGDYQVILWTSVILFVAFLATVYALIGIGDEPKDPALYASVTKTA